MGQSPHSFVYVVISHCLYTRDNIKHNGEHEQHLQRSVLRITSGAHYYEEISSCAPDINII